MRATEVFPTSLPFLILNTHEEGLPCALIYANVIDIHPLRKLRGAVGIAGPISPDRKI